MSKKIEWDNTEAVWVARPEVIAAWVFGSAQGGRVQPGGDIDIGVLFESLPSLEVQFELLADLQQSLRVEDVDLIVLNEANPILRFEAISGRPLFCRDAGRRAEFVSLTAREYEDGMAFVQWALRNRGSA